VKEARELVHSGKLGKIRKVVVEYPQGWLATRIEASGQKQAAWRTDPKRSGAAGCIGDIGTHAENLAEYITGLQIQRAGRRPRPPSSKGRKLDDDGNVLLRFKGGAKGVLHSSEISVGEENNLNIRVYGELGGLEWHQKEPNTLLVKWQDQPMQVYRTANGYLSAAAKAAGRTPPAHPEGYLEALRQHLQELRLRHPRPQRRTQAGQGRSGERLPEDRGRRARHGLHRGRGEILQGQRRLDEARRLIPRESERRPRDRRPWRGFPGFVFAVGEKRLIGLARVQRLSAVEGESALLGRHGPWPTRSRHRVGLCRTCNRRRGWTLG
jgi:hypothetical protein